MKRFGGTLHVVLFVFANNDRVRWYVSLPYPSHNMNTYSCTFLYMHLWLELIPLSISPAPPWHEIQTHERPRSTSTHTYIHTSVKMTDWINTLFSLRAAVGGKRRSQELRFKGRVAAARRCSMQGGDLSWVDASFGGKKKEKKIHLLPERSRG